MSNQTSNLLPLLHILVIILIVNDQFCRFVEGGGKRRIHITDNLDDVIDDEEDEAWKQWGKKSSSSSEFDPPPMDFSEMEMPQIQDEMMKRQVGPVFGFVKLRLGSVRRTPDMVSEIAMKWSKLSRTGAIETKFMGFDLSTIMFTMEKGQDSMELKEFVLNQPEAYEVKIGDQVFRRTEDPPFEQVIEKLRSHGHQKDEL